MLTWSSHPSSTQSVTWRTDTTVHLAIAQVVIASDGPKMADIARTDTAATQLLDTHGVPNAGDPVHFHSHAGDLVNDGNHHGQWGEWFSAGGFIHAMVPSVPAAGNHEYHARSAEEAAPDSRIGSMIACQTTCSRERC